MTDFLNDIKRSMKFVPEENFELEISNSFSEFRTNNFVV